MNPSLELSKNSAIARLMSRYLMANDVFLWNDVFLGNDVFLKNDVKASLIRRLPSLPLLFTAICGKIPSPNIHIRYIYIYISYMKYVNGRLTGLVTFCVETAFYNRLLKER
jgi:hypothetical protein